VHRNCRLTAGVDAAGGAAGSAAGAAAWGATERAAATAGHLRVASIEALAASREAADEVLFGLETAALVLAAKGAGKSGMGAWRAAQADEPSRAALPAVERPILALHASPRTAYADAADAVDALLAAHSLLEIVHEPEPEPEPTASADVSETSLDVVSRLWLVRVAPVAPMEAAILRTLDALHFSGDTCDGPGGASSLEAPQPFWSSGWGADLYNNWCWGLIKGLVVGAPWRAYPAPRCFVSLANAALGARGTTAANVTEDCTWHYARAEAGCSRQDDRCLFLDSSPCAHVETLDWLAQRRRLEALLKRDSAGAGDNAIATEIRRQFKAGNAERVALIDGASERLLDVQRSGQDTSAGDDTRKMLDRVLHRINQITWNREREDIEPLPDEFFSALAATARRAAERALLAGRLEAAAAAEATAQLAEAITCDAPGCAGRLRFTVFYWATRPRWRLRQEVAARAHAFLAATALGRSAPCAVLHARRGDIVLQENYLRRYVHVAEQLEEAEDILAAERIEQIFLMTDSQEVVEEALALEEQFAYRFTWLPKTRFRAYEGQFENPFPSNNQTEEAVDILTGLAVAAEAGCKVWMGGDMGNFGKMIYQYQCRGEWRRPSRSWHCPKMGLVKTKINGGEVTLEHIDARVAKGDFFSKQIDWDALLEEHRRNQSLAAASASAGGGL